MCMCRRAPAEVGLAAGAAAGAGVWERGDTTETAAARAAPGIDPGTRRQVGEGAPFSATHAS